VYILSENDNGWTEIEFKGISHSIPSEYLDEIDKGLIDFKEDVVEDDIEKSKNIKKIKENQE